MVGVIFVRNALAVVVMFALNPWLDGMGLQNTFILLSVVCLLITLLPVPFFIWGKKARASTSQAYQLYAERQPFRRH